MEAFYTIQGEGCWQGHAAFFIRLAGCKVGCFWCDVKESWQIDAHPTATVEEILQQAVQYPARIAVITGGEPLMHNLFPLTRALKAAGFRTHLETSGAYPLSGTWDWICFSPKKFMAPCPEIYAHANELKVIIYNKSDFAFAEQFAKVVPTHCQLLLQPEWEKSSQMMPFIVEYVKKNPQWRISLQTHKFMNIP
ncbi:MAG: 7-carboxy-7-deazaguanine synthase QueE [Cytophagales bacterium]|nr:7-carboxy-7-deazaguanine synthase QueE [Bernardetiaceae bacterium]MDW8210203.1 7-carboxy-7-deazaguanine synthase QueE [Cytophagales bacterium]